MVDEQYAREFMVNLVVQIAWDKPAGVEHRDRCFRHSSWSGQLSNERNDHMGRRVQAFNRAMTCCVVQVRLDRDLLSCLISRIASSMSAIEVVENGVPCLGVTFLIC